MEVIIEIVGELLIEFLFEICTNKSFPALLRYFSILVLGGGYFALITAILIIGIDLLKDGKMLNGIAVIVLDALFLLIVILAAVKTYRSRKDISPIL